MEYVVIHNAEAAYLCHHGIKGQNWGVRRWQNDDGSVTPAGALRYYVGGRRTMGSKGGETKLGAKQKSGMSDEQKAKLKKALKVAGIAAGAIGAAALTYKAVKTGQDISAGYKIVKEARKKQKQLEWAHKVAQARTVGDLKWHSRNGISDYVPGLEGYFRNNYDKTVESIMSIQNWEQPGLKSRIRIAQQASMKDLPGGYERYFDALNNI